MTSCYASSWEAGEKGHFERLLTFVSEVDRTDYIKQYPANGGGIVELLPIERAFLMRSLALKFKMILIIKDQVTGLFEEH